MKMLTPSYATEEGLLHDAFMFCDLNGNRTGKKGRRLEADGKQAAMAVSYRYDRMNRLANNVKPDGTLGNGPAQPHIGYQTPGKGKERVRGHIFVDDVPATRR